MDKVQKGEIKMNTGTLYPYDIVCNVIRGEELSDEQKKALDVTWNALPNYTKDENALVVVDGSGSMYCYGTPMPAAVAQSLGIYFAERNTGAFKNHFITFSTNPQHVEIKGDDIYDKVRFCMGFNECANTNIQKVFELILNTAVKNKLSQKDLPETIYVISDMEFDYCTEDSGLTNFEFMQKIFDENGYKLPKLVFGNVNSWQQQVPVKENEQGVVLVSGCTPKIFEMVMNGETSPYKFMLDTVNTERYEKITA